MASAAFEKSELNFCSLPRGFIDSCVKREADSRSQYHLLCCNQILQRPKLLISYQRRNWDRRAMGHLHSRISKHRGGLRSSGTLLWRYSALGLQTAKIDHLTFRSKFNSDPPIFDL
jgi:hypothetical protein